MVTLRELAKERVAILQERHNGLVKTLISALLAQGFEVDDNRAVFTVPELGIGYIVEIHSDGRVKSHGKWSSNIADFDIDNPSFYEDYFYTRLTAESIADILSATVRNITDLIDKAPFAETEGAYSLPYSADA